MIHRNSDAEEEEEEEDHYTYEIPPSEGQGKMLAAAHQLEAAESMYLDRAAARRCSEPSNLQPRPRMFLSKSGTDRGIVEETFNFEALERALQKGIMKNAMGLPLSARRVSLPVLPSPGFEIKDATNKDPFLPLKEDKESHEESIYLECEPDTGGSLKSGSLPEECGMQNKAWYAGSCDRQTAEAALLQYNKDSAYLVRRSSRYGGNQPFTLAVLYKSHVYNIPIRYIESSHQYSLGKDGRSQEELFDSVSSIIQSYTERPMTLIDGKTSAKEQTCLVFPVKP
ncbi:SH2 domain-containing protein 6 [Anolis sagrei]|uniref:SH2 domain-containing protein 6 n=1 Tax=Anolis sagrei TaxID=38937 RepID=UPI003521E4AA